MKISHQVVFPLTISFFTLFSSFAFAETKPALATYDQLLTAIRTARSESRARVEAAVEQEKVQEAWEIGKLIDEHVLQRKERADYDQRVVERLAGDLGMDRTELYRMLKFYREYPIVVPAQQLSWSHYHSLLAVNDSDKRKELAKRAAEEHWSRDRVREEVRKLKKAAGEPVETEKPLTALPGKVGTYRVIRAKVGPEAGKLVIDLGFSDYYSTPETAEFEDRQIVRCPDDHCRAEKDMTESDLYTYNAYVVRVLDGDTVEAVIDLGFGFRTVQTLRLRGIDAPEILTSDGKAAREALEKMIAESQELRAKGKVSLISSLSALSSLPILIRTTKSDKYDRYLVDIWIPNPNGLVRPRQGRGFPDGSDNLYVNQKLVDDGRAVIVEP